MRILKLIPTLIFCKLTVLFVLLQLGFTLFFVMVFYFVQGYSNSIPLGQLPKLVQYVIPCAQEYMNQVVVLVTCCGVFSQMASSREFVVLHASGISAFRVTFPALILALVMSWVSFHMGDLHRSWGKYGIAEVVSASAEDIIYQMLRTEHRFTYQDYTLSVRSVEGRTLIEPFITPNDSSSGDVYSAASATLEIGRMNELWKPDEEILFVPLFSMERVQERQRSPETTVKISFENISLRVGKSRVDTHHKHVVYVSLDQFKNQRLLQDVFDERPATMSIARLETFIAEKSREIEQAQSDILELTAVQLMLGSWTGFEQERWAELHQNIRDAQWSIERAKLEPIRRRSAAFNCFVIALLVIPSMVRFGHHNPIMLFVVAMAVLFLCYYAPQFALIDCAKKHVVPPAALWLPNVAAILVGLWMLRPIRVKRLRPGQHTGLGEE